MEQKVQMDLPTCTAIPTTNTPQGSGPLVTIDEAALTPKAHSVGQGSLLALHIP